MMPVKRALNVRYHRIYSGAIDPKLTVSNGKDRRKAVVVSVSETRGLA